MTLVEHLYEFRRRLTYALLAIAAGAVFGFLWFDIRLGPIMSLGEAIRGPYCSLPNDLLVDFGDAGESCRLLQIEPFEVFMIRLKVGVAAGMVLFAPIWLYQIWAFVAPGLYPKERRYGQVFVGIATVLFALGAALAYIIVPFALHILVNFGGDNFATAFTGQKYISFMLTLLIIFGVSFELPLMIIMLNRVGVLSYETLKRWRRGLILAMFVFAAMVTPADPFSMLALAFALVVLFEMAIQVSRLHDKKVARLRTEQGWDDVADDEAAPFDYVPSSVDGAEAEEAASRGGEQRPTDDVT